MSASSRDRIIQCATAKDGFPESSITVALAAAREALLIAQERMRGELPHFESYIRACQVIDRVLADLSAVVPVSDPPIRHRWELAPRVEQVQEEFDRRLDEALPGGIVRADKAKAILRDVLAELWPLPTA